MASESIAHETEGLMGYWLHTFLIHLGEERESGKNFLVEGKRVKLPTQNNAIMQYLPTFFQVLSHDVLAPCLRWRHLTTSIRIRCVFTFLLRLAMSELPQASFLKRGQVRRHWYENNFFILMQIKLIFTRKVWHLTSFWKWGFLELGSGLFSIPDVISQLSSG